MTWARAWLALLLCCLVGAGGCNKEAGAKSSGLTHVRVAWIGLVCEAPIFAAYENGYFKDEGLDCELVHTDWDSFQAGMSFNRFDATHTLGTYLLKPIEQGLDIKFTGGVHKGCLRLQAGINTDIHKLEDMRGKRIGVSTIGSPPMVFVSRALAAHGVDPEKQVQWVVYPADVSELALKKGQVDAIADSEPIGSLLENHKAVRTVLDQMLDVPYKDEFCCAVVISGPLARRSPETAAKLTRAILRGAKWVGKNPHAAAEIEVKRRYISKADVELNAAVLTKLSYSPAVETCRTGLEVQCVEMKLAHVLNASTDPKELAARSWMALDGVTDEWLQHVPVDKVAGGGPVSMDPEVFADRVLKRPPCCNKCCMGE